VVVFCSRLDNYVAVVVVAGVCSSFGHGEVSIDQSQLKDSLWHTSCWRASEVDTGLAGLLASSWRICHCYGSMSTRLDWVPEVFRFFSICTLLVLLITAKNLNFSSC
jgi:hypothetical protein